MSQDEIDNFANRVNNSDLDYDLIMQEGSDLKEEFPEFRPPIAQTSLGYDPAKIEPDWLQAFRNFQQVNHFDHYDPHYGFDLCPVCGLVFLDSNQRYCSEVCLKAAHLYRRRLSKTVQFLRNIGFTATYTNGVQLEVRPDPMLATMLPVSSRSMTFPSLNTTVETLTVKDLYQRLRDWLGQDLGHYIEMITYEISFRDRNPKLLFQNMCHMVFGDHMSTFKCSNCEVKYLKSSDTYAPEDERCEDCTASKIPF